MNRYGALASKDDEVEEEVSSKKIGYQSPKKTAYETESMHADSISIELLQAEITVVENEDKIKIYGKSNIIAKKECAKKNKEEESEDDDLGLTEEE